jgi:hypothetical protein
MRFKLALILMALVGSTLVAPAPAQEPSRRVDRNFFFATNPGQPPVPPVPPIPAGGQTVNSVYTTSVPAYSQRGTFIGGWISSPEEANLAQEADQLTRQLGEAKSDGERDKIKTKLGEILQKQFDQRQKRHEHEIEELEAQVKKLKDLVAKRQENRREIIARRLEQIVRESQGLGW